MVQALDVRTLWSNADFQVVSTVWDRERHAAQDERQAGWAAIEWMRRGSFRKVVRGQTLVADTNHAIFFNPGEVFRVSHPVGRANNGTTIRLSPDVLTDVVGDFNAAAAGEGDHPFRRTHVATGGRCHLLQEALISHLDRGGDVEPLTVEEAVWGLVRTVVETSLGGAAVSRERLASPIARRRVAAMQDFLSASFAMRVRLADVAAAGGCSPWHAAHLFSACMGVSMRRYLRRIRLRETLARLSEYGVDLTRAALEGGFASHSHFTAAFRVEFGITPSAVRAAWARDLLARLTDIRDTMGR